MTTETLIAQYPCCDKPCRLAANSDLPRETVERRHFCAADDEVGTTYAVTRTRVARIPGIEINEVEFFDLASDEAFQQYGSRRMPRRTVSQR